MQIISYPVHYQSVCTNFDFSLFSRISCTLKTILLQRKNHTFARRICNTQITNTLRTLREYILNGLRMRGEQIATTLRTDCHNILNKLQTHKKHKKQPKHNARARPLQHHIYINYIIYLHIFAYLK